MGSPYLEMQVPRLKLRTKEGRFQVLHPEKFPQKGSKYLSIAIHWKLRGYYLNVGHIHSLAVSETSETLRLYDCDDFAGIKKTLKSVAMPSYWRSRGAYFQVVVRHVTFQKDSYSRHSTAGAVRTRIKDLPFSGWTKPMCSTAFLHIKQKIVVFAMFCGVKFKK